MNNFENNNQLKNEPYQLSKLLKAIKVQAEADIVNKTDSYYQIFIGGELIHLACGGPQLEGLYCLVDQIAAENLYTVDYKNCTIK